MVKGVAIKFRGYEETIPKLLDLIKFDQELKKHERVVLKPDLVDGGEHGTPVKFVEQVLRYCVERRNPGTEIFIAEGCNGFDTAEVLEEQGYKALAEKYGVGLIDLNKAETEGVFNDKFMYFQEISYPKILLDSFVVSLPVLKSSEERKFLGALSNMVGAFPAREYRGFFSLRKNKLDKVSRKHQIHDILVCKMPEFTIADASEQGHILAGQPLEIDKQGTKLFGLDWREVDYLPLIEESFNSLEA